MGCSPRRDDTKPGISRLMALDELGGTAVRYSFDRDQVKFKVFRNCIRSHTVLLEFGLHMKLVITRPAGYIFHRCPNGRLPGKR